MLSKLILNITLALILFTAISVWLEYAQFAIGGMGREDGIPKARQVFDRALTACGLHVTKGANLWEAYREFENAILAGLLVISFAKLFISSVYKRLLKFHQLLKFSSMHIS